MKKKNTLIGILLALALIGFIKRDFLYGQFAALSSALNRYNNKELNIAMVSRVMDLTSYELDPDTLTRTANIYEGLVAFDKNLKIIPALALSWGNLTPTLWEFKLRRDVRFHDGENFDAAALVQSFEQAYSSAKENSQLALYFKAIAKVLATDPYTIQIETEVPDPLLLAKLTKCLVSRPGHIGTGPYKIREWVPGKTLSLTVFEDYWGKQPRYRNVKYSVIEDKLQRKLDFENGKIDILAAVPPEQAEKLPQEQLKKSFSLEVNMLMFKLDHPLLSSMAVREGIQSLIDPAKIIAIGNNLVRQASQFVAPGVFGYNPDILPYQFDEIKIASDLFGKRVEKISLDFLETYQTLGEYLAKQLRIAGFSVQTNPLLPEKLIDRIRKNESPLFLIGWQAEDGDAGSFLDAFIRSNGEFNKGRYSNQEIDRLIEQSQREMDSKKRLSMLQEIFSKLQQDLVGIPLFESSKLYAVKPGIDWEPRVDGLVLAAEVK